MSTISTIPPRQPIFDPETISGKTEQFMMDTMGIGKEKLGDVLNAGRNTSNPERTQYPRVNNVTNLSGAYSYPNNITGDALGFVNYMPYPHGKPQAGMAEVDISGNYQTKVDSNPIQVNLHMPSDMTDSVSAKWQADADIFAKTAQLGAGEAVLGTVQKGLKDAVTGIGGKVAEIVTLGKVSAEGLKQGLERSHGHAIRPFESQFFQGVDYRTFSFKHKLMAFEQGDTIEINKIIKILRYHSSPGLALNGVMYKYPSSWRIRFYQADPNNKDGVIESQWLPTLKRCVLEKVEVNHFASNTPSYHTNLAPVDIEISLSFREMDYVTKRSIENETQPMW